MRFWLNLASYHVTARNAPEALSALRCALACANREGTRDERASIMRAMNYARAITRLRTS